MVAASNSIQKKGVDQSLVSRCRDSEPQISNTIDRTATIVSAADATLIVRVKRRFIIDRDLFTGFDITQSNEENVIVEDLHERVGRAGVIDVVSAISATASIEAPAIVDLTNAEHGPVSPAPGFGV